MKETWEKITKEIRICVSKEPVLSDFFEQSVLNHASLDESLAFILAKLLSEPSATVEILKDIFLEVFLVRCSCYFLLKKACAPRTPKLAQIAIPRL